MTRSVEKQRLADAKETIERLQQELIEKSDMIFSLIEISAQLTKQNKELRDKNLLGKDSIKLYPTKAYNPDVTCFENCFVMLKDTQKPDSTVSVHIVDSNLQTIFKAKVPRNLITIRSWVNEQNKTRAEV